MGMDCELPDVFSAQDNKAAVRPITKAVTISVSVALSSCEVSPEQSHEVYE